jgi:hypothetical protein
MLKWTKLYKKKSFCREKVVKNEGFVQSYIKKVVQCRAWEIGNENVGGKKGHQIFKSEIRYALKILNNSDLEIFCS